jgi:tetratricopeptide (TPR) repeat protein
MNLQHAVTFVGMSLALGGCSSVVHTPAHTSVEIALARKAVVTRMPETVHSEPRLTSYRAVYVPAVEPALPTNDRIEAVAETFTRGKDALQAGKNDEAIQAFQEATKVDDRFGDAWEYLAHAYEKVGKTQEAKDAFQHYKRLASH